MIGVAQVIGTNPYVSLFLSRFFIASSAMSCKDDSEKTLVKGRPYDLKSGEKAYWPSKPNLVDHYRS